MSYTCNHTWNKDGERCVLCGAKDWMTDSSDDCSVCDGANGGVRGNENIVNGVVICDYCHAKDLKLPPAPAQAERPICQSCEETIHLREDGEWAHEDNAMECFIGPHSPKAWPLRFRRGVAYERPAAPAQEVKRIHNHGHCANHCECETCENTYASLSAELAAERKSSDQVIEIGNKYHDDFERVDAENRELRAELERVKQERDEYEETFELQFAASVRAIERWRSEHPGNERVWPDKTNMEVWLMEKLTTAESQLSAAREALEKIGRMICWTIAAGLPQPKTIGPDGTCDCFSCIARRALAALNGGPLTKKEKGE